MTGRDAPAGSFASIIGVAALSVGGALLGMLACGGGGAKGGAEPPAPAAEPAPAELPRATASPRAIEPALRPITSAPVCATLGTLHPSPNGLFRIDDPKLRATVAGSHGRGIELSFRYLGSTTKQARLRSGRERRQLGLELLARDTCNLLYVMWRLEPVAELVVSIKQNRGQSSHSECENRGYRPLRPAFSAPPPSLAPGSEHRLRAEITDGVLSVQVDGASVWRGPLDAGARELGGRSGVRSDNVRFEVRELHADVRGEEGTCAGVPAAPR